MKPWQLLALVALSGAAAMFTSGCSDDDAADEAAGATGASGEVSDDGAAMDEAVSGADDELDSGPIPEEQFNQLKELWSGQILRIEESTRTLAGLNEEHKDEALGRMIEDLTTKAAQMRKSLEEATTTSRQFLERELPRLMEESGALLQKAQERMQEVLAAKAGLPAPR